MDRFDQGMPDVGVARFRVSAGSEKTEDALYDPRAPIGHSGYDQEVDPKNRTADLGED